MGVLLIIREKVKRRAICQTGSSGLRASKRMIFINKLSQGALQVPPAEP